MKKTPFDFIIATVFPDRCVFCNSVIKHRINVCKKCKNEIEPLTDICCDFCGLPKNECCCGTKDLFYSKLAAVYRYNGGVRDGIRRWKFSGNPYATPYFATVLADRVRDVMDADSIDLVTFIPQTEAESNEKGFNQSELLARETGKQLGIPVRQVLVKLFETKRQHDIPLHLKKGNVFGVFDCINPDLIKDKRILIVDDVKTSGATLNECAKMLALCYAQDVFCTVVAATQKKGED